MSYLGRGYESVPGKPFQWAWYQERAEIRQHLLAKGWQSGDMRLEFRISRIQERLHKYKPTFKERQAAWYARQAKPTTANVAFTFEELERIAEHFTGANDPITASIAAKALAALERQP